MRYILKKTGIIGALIISLVTLGACNSHQVAQTSRPFGRGSLAPLRLRSGAEATLAEPPNLPQQRTENFCLIETVEGRPRWKLEADLALVYEEAARTDLHKVNATFYQDGEAISTLNSREGIMYMSSGDLEARGKVVVTSRHGRLESERILWDASAEEFTSPDFVKITRATHIITGFGIEADPNLEKVRIDRDVKVEARVR
jgi:LPS export ABC transporter protein LptC